WRQCLTERDEGRFDGLRRFARGRRGTPRALLRPGGFSGPIALLPLVQPAFGTAHLLADDLNGVAVEVGVSVQSMQKVPISLVCKINWLAGYRIFFSNKISGFLR